jgi:hypothetical protein
VSATAYSFVTASPPQFFRPNGLPAEFATSRIVEEDASVSQFAALPTGLAYYLHFGGKKDRIGHVLGLSVTVPSYEDRSLEANLVAEGPAGRITAKQRSTRRFRMLVFGPSYAMRLGDRLRFGASLFGYWANASFDEHTIFSKAAIGAAGPSFQNSRVLLDAHAFGLLGIVGAQVGLTRELWAGLSFETRGFSFAGNGDVDGTTDTAAVDPARGQLAQRINTTAGLDFGISRPFRISAGVAYEKRSRFALAADLHLHPPIPDAIRATGDGISQQVLTGAAPTVAVVPAGIRVGSRTTLNPSIGGEIQPFKRVVFRAGAFTDLDAVESFTSAGERSDRLDWYGVTFGVGHMTSPLGATYGVIYRYGRGSMQTFGGFDVTQPSTTVDYTAHGIMVVLSATFEIGAPVDALADGLRPTQYASAQAR